MAEIVRQSPIQFKARPNKIDVRDNWRVTLEYEDEGDGPWMTDLAHKTRWDLQDRRIKEFDPCDLAVPAIPGGCTFAGQKLINRMNGTQASIYHLDSPAPALPDFPGYTDVSESTVFLALSGLSTFFVAEKLTNLDFMDPAKTPPFLLQRPFCHVPCQIVTLEKTAVGSGGFLLTFSRGYGESMVDAILNAGAEFGLRPAGEDCFIEWIKGV
jgi:hypothetical protein